MRKSALIQVARQEVKAWGHRLPNGLVMAILFAFVHRVTTGETVEETFLAPKGEVWGYEI